MLNSTIDSLPDEIMLMIFKQFSWQELMAFSLVSKKWLDLVGQSSRLRLCLDLGMMMVQRPHRFYQNLKIRNVPLTPNVMFWPARQPLLEDCLNTVIVGVVSQEALQNILKYCKNLIHFKILEGVSAEILDFSDFAELSHLRELCLVGDATVVFESLDKMEEMRKLWLHGVSISDKSMQQLIKSMPNLELLETKRIQGITSDAFLSGDGLGGWARLESLALPSSIINDELVEKMQLPKLRKLCFFLQQHLQTSQTSITDTLAENCPILEVINGTNNSIRFKRDLITNKFEPVSHMAESNTTVEDNANRIALIDLDQDDIIELYSFEYEDYDPRDDQFGEEDDGLLDFHDDIDDYDYYDDNDYLLERLNEEMMD